MPKAASNTLIWSMQQQAYITRTAHAETQQEPLLLRESDPRWFSWLADRTSLSFQGKHGRLNLLKETRARGREGYWYAYARHGKRIAKRYAGRTSDLTILALEMLAQTLATDTESKTTAHAMSSQPVLASQLHPPALPTPLVARTHLLTILDTSLNTPLTLLCAPAGSGKTTLLAHWATQQKQLVAWLSLDRAQNDLPCFLSYLIAALQQVIPGCGRKTLATLHESTPSMSNSLIYLLNELADLQLPLTIVLDNYHLLEQPAVHQAIELLLDHLPANIHLVITSRADPPHLPARHRVSSHVVAIEADALRLTRPELANLLAYMLHREASNEELDALDEQITGWVSALSLARTSGQDQGNWALLLAACSGTNRYLQSYFLEEVVATLPQELQTFLLSTVLLQSCNSSLCEAVTGHQDSDQLVEKLTHMNVFFRPIHEREGWYRYHPLFASALSHYLARTQPQHFLALHRQASTWFAQHHSPREAIEHALAAQDHDHAIALIEIIVPSLIREGNIALLDRWLDSLPKELVHASPQLCIGRIWQQFITSQPQKFMQWVETAEQSLRKVEATQPPAATAPWRDEIIALRSLYTISFDDHSLAIASCQHVLQHLSADDHYLRGLLLFLLGVAYTRSVDVNAAAQALAQASNHIRTIGHTLLLPCITIGQAELYATQGYPFQAARLYQQALAMQHGKDTSALFVAGMAHIGLGNLQLEWNNLAQANEHLLLAWDLGQRIHNTSLLFQSSWLLASIAQAQAQNTNTQSWLHQLEALDQQSSYIEITEIIAPIRAHFALLEGRLEEALLWLHEQQTRTTPGMRQRNELIDLVQARILIASQQAGIEPAASSRALELLQYWYDTTDQAGRVRILIEVLILQALARQTQNDRPGALRALERAVNLAEPGRYIRLFVSEGDPLARLLRLLLDEQRTRKNNEQGTNIAYLNTLLKAFLQPDTFFLPTSRVESQPLFDPLSLREREVLRLIAAGRKNREIADELVVVTGTVKAHVNMIYQKLGVTNRVQAVTRARSLGLLEA